MHGVWLCFGNMYVIGCLKQKLTWFKVKKIPLKSFTSYSGDLGSFHRSSKTLQSMILCLQCSVQCADFHSWVCAPYSSKVEDCSCLIGPRGWSQSSVLQDNNKVETKYKDYNLNSTHLLRVMSNPCGLRKLLQ